jgi:hypothetical protein
MMYREWGDNLDKRGRIILAGGEVLVDPVREEVLYPTLSALGDKYQGKVKIIIQTTGDLLKPALIEDLLNRGAWMISVSGLDTYHDGIDPARLQEKLTAWFQQFGMSPGSGVDETPGPHYHFFGATPDSWIGKLWPRGRAWSNSLSTATLADNFCARWSGGANFLDSGHAGSEVSIDPDGNVYPCCIKTKLPIGNLLDEPLEAILNRLTGHPVYEAISMGHPERMGIRYGWSVEDFLAKSRTRLPSGVEYQNLCVGCDRFHDEVLSAGLVQIEGDRHG